MVLTKYSLPRIQLVSYEESKVKKKKLEKKVADVLTFPVLVDNIIYNSVCTYSFDVVFVVVFFA